MDFVRFGKLMTAVPTVDYEYASGRREICEENCVRSPVYVVKCVNVTPAECLVRSGQFSGVKSQPIEPDELSSKYFKPGSVHSI